MSRPAIALLCMPEPKQCAIGVDAINTPRHTRRSRGVVARCFVRVMHNDFPAQRDFGVWFDSRQLHHKTAVEEREIRRDELVRCSNGSWMIRPLQSCPHGHRFRPGATLVGHQPCSCRDGHASWTCLVCGAGVYGPRLRVSTATSSPPGRGAPSARRAHGSE